jgi:hypothetical protein
MTKRALWLPLGLMLALLGAGCNSAVESTEKFSRPDIKDDFCGVHINYQYCKCAFHNDYCDNIGLSRSAARAYVNDEYDKWVDERLAGFAAACATKGGAYDNGVCRICAAGYAPQDGDCREATETADEDDGSDGDESATAYVPDGPLNEDCTINQEEFDTDWRRYSDIDERIPFESRSWEAQNAVSAYDQMIETMVTAFEIERDLEIERQTQAELQKYKDALVQNLRTNLLKSFWRLAWVTYSTIDSSRGVGQSYSTLLTEGMAVETVGAGLKVIQANIPAQSALAIDTSGVGGKAASVGANTALELVDSLGDPVKVATEFMKSSTMATMPSADISPEEVAILRQQHLENGRIDDAIIQSQETITAMEGMLMMLEDDMQDFRSEVAEWEAKEKARVAASLEASCRELNDQE